MVNSKIIVFVLSALSFTASLAYCQEKTGDRQLMTVSGIVSMVDSVGSIIEVDTGEGKMAFTVPDDASITQGTQNIGLMDIDTNYPVTIEYYSPSPGKFVVVSITYNNDS